MNVFKTYLCKNGMFDWYLDVLLGKLPYNYVPLEQANVVFLTFVHRSGQKNYEFDAEGFEAVRKSGLPIIVFDLCEHEYAIRDCMIVGYALCGKRWHNSEVEKLHNALLGYDKTILYLKRELPKGANVKFPMLPLELCIDDPPPIAMHTGKEFDARPIDILMVWGMSHESRQLLMAEFLKKWRDFHIKNFCLTLDDVKRELAEGKNHIVALLYRHREHRIPLDQLYILQQKAKITISCWGEGIKCLRSAEASFNSVLAQQEPNLIQWTYPWIGGKNCIELPNMDENTIYTGSSVEILRRYVWETPQLLYPLYFEGVDNSRKYRYNYYIEHNLVPAIEQATWKL